MNKIKQSILLTFVVIFLLYPTQDKAAGLTIHPEEYTLEGQVVYFSKLYNTNPALVSKVMECESNGKQSAVGDYGLSRGVMQFQKETFNRLSKLMGEELNYNSSFDQIKLATWAIANGHGSNWTAYRAIMNGGSYTFYSRQLQQWYIVHCKL